MKKYLKKKSNAPGNDYTISQTTSDTMIKNFDPELFDQNKWIRFKMTGNNQGVEGIFGYYIDDSNNNIHYYYVEQHSFQTPEIKNIKYKNIFLYCEVDENGIAKSNVNIQKGSDEFPFIVLRALKTRYDIDNKISITMCDKTISKTKNKAEKELENIRR